MKRILIAFFCFFSIQISLCGQIQSNTKSTESFFEKNNIYKFPDTVRILIQAGIKKIITQSKLDSVKDEDFYILLSDFNGETLLAVNYCRKCHEKQIIKSTDRFFKLNNGSFLPVIFKYDLEYSEFLYDEKGFKINVGMGGYFIIFNNKGEIRKLGFQQ